MYEFWCKKSHLYYWMDQLPMHTLINLAYTNLQWQNCFGRNIICLILYLNTSSTWAAQNIIYPWKNCVVFATTIFHMYQLFVVRKGFTISNHTITALHYVLYSPKTGIGDMRMYLNLTLHDFKRWQVRKTQRICYF